MELPENTAVCPYCCLEPFFDETDDIFEFGEEEDFQDDCFDGYDD